jgi:hypothetical protein
MARKEDCGAHRKIEGEKAAEGGMIEFPIQSPFVGGFDERHATVIRVTP